MSFVQKPNRGGYTRPNQPTVNSILISYVSVLPVAFWHHVPDHVNVVQATCARCCDKSQAFWAK